MYKLHKKVQQLFFYLMVTKFILVLLSKNILKMRYSKYCILKHIPYTTIEALLYQPLRFILTFKVIEVWFLSEGSIANMTCIYTFMHPSLALHLSISLMTKDILHNVFVRTIDYLYVSINHYPQHVLFFHIISYPCVMHLFSI